MQANYPNGVNSMTLLEKHPILADIPNYLNGANNLPGPWRTKRLCANDGRSPAFDQLVNYIWNQVRPAHMPVNYMQGGVLMNRMPTLGTNFFAQFILSIPLGWNQAVNSIRVQANGNLTPLYKARGTFLNLIIRSGFLTQAMVANVIATGANFPAIPARIANYCALPPLPLAHNPPRRPMSNIRANPSSSYVWAREHELCRARHRKHRTVWYNGAEHRLTDLTRTQCALLDVNDNPPLNNVPNVGWLWAANQP